MSDTQRPGEAEIVKSQPHALSAIRSATAFARLPLHQLSKKGKINIRIIERDAAGGQIALKWVVSPNTEYGMPGQLAYKIDTIVIQRRLDELPRPLPRIIRVGTLSDIARELDLVTGDTASIKQALLQNASSFVTAKLKYKTPNGEASLGGKDEVGFTRYAIRFRGEQLDNGQTIECVYIIFNDPYYGVLNNSTVRPLDHSYLKALTVGAQRFYEILSFEMFSALKYPNVRAKLLYSRYSMLAPQTRYLDKQRMQSQMAKIHRLHITNGYITKALYENTTDAEGNPDWIITYTPGPRAIEEYEFFNGKRASLPATTPRHRALKEPNIEAAPVDETLLAELTKRGIGQTKAREILSKMTPADLIPQLEYTDLLIAQAPEGKYHNPAGLYITRLTDYAPVPATFETSAKRKERQEAEQRRAQDQRALYELHQAEERQIDDWWEALTSDDREARITLTLPDVQAKFPVASPSAQRSRAEVHAKDRFAAEMRAAQATANPETHEQP